MSIPSPPPPKTLLTHLRTLTSVDCDTLDSSIASTLGPFTDCTSNQAIAYLELSHHKRSSLLRHAASLARKYHPKYHSVSLPTLAVEIATILLALRIVPNLTGFSHLQTNPIHSYDTAKTIEDAVRLVELMREIGKKQELNGGDCDYDERRVCVKIPSTWEGLMACLELEKYREIRTLATTLFTIEQAQLAAEVRCCYVAPYVNELRVHFDEGYKDPSPNLSLPVQIQTYYTNNSLPTQVLPASLTSINECMALAGAHYITISPPLLQELADTPAGADVNVKFPSLFAQEEQQQQQHGKAEVVMKRSNWLDDESGYRLAVTRSDAGRQEGKLTQAVNIFCEMQERLEGLMEGVLNE